MFQNPKTFNIWQKISSTINWAFEPFRAASGSIYEAALRKQVKQLGLTLHQNAKLVWKPDQGGLICGNNVYLGIYSVLFIADDFRGGAEKGRVEFGNDIYIGDHCNIRAAGGLIKIGSKVLVGNHVTMIAANHGMNLGTPMFDQPWANFPLDIHIHDDCWIGAHATLLPGARILSGAIVAAGAVVVGEVPSNEIWGGIPAKKIGERQG